MLIISNACSVRPGLFTWPTIATDDDGSILSPPHDTGAQLPPRNSHTIIIVTSSSAKCVTERRQQHVLHVKDDNHEILNLIQAIGTFQTDISVTSPGIRSIQLPNLKCRSLAGRSDLEKAIDAPRGQPTSINKTGFGDLVVVLSGAGTGLGT